MHHRLIVKRGLDAVGERADVGGNATCLGRELADVGKRGARPGVVALSRRQLQIAQHVGVADIGTVTAYDAGLPFAEE